MYNNDVTYHKKWNTEENRKYQSKVWKYADRSTCSSDCPLAWSKEVYELLKDLDEKFGIAYDLSTNKGYHYDPRIRNVLYLMFLEPILSIKYLIKSIWRDMFDPSKYVVAKHPTALSRLKYTLFRGRGFLRGWSIARRLITGSIYNKFKKPQIRLSQVKEKYGHLNVYYDAPEWAENYIDDRIRLTEVKLAEKGTYYSVESMYYSHTSWYDRTHSYQAKAGSFVDSDGNKVKYTDTKHYTYRKVLQNAGYDLEELKKKADRKRRRDARQRKKSKTGNSR